MDQSERPLNDNGVAFQPLIWCTRDLLTIAEFLIFVHLFFHISLLHVISTICASVDGLMPFWPPALCEKKFKKILYLRDAAVHRTMSAHGSSARKYQITSCLEMGWYQIFKIDSILIEHFQNVPNLCCQKKRSDVVERPRDALCHWIIIIIILLLLFC